MHEAINEKGPGFLVEFVLDLSAPLRDFDNDVHVERRVAADRNLGEVHAGTPPGRKGRRGVAVLLLAVSSPWRGLPSGKRLRGLPQFCRRVEFCRAS
jgi:hypothetical protein